MATKDKKDTTLEEIYDIEKKHSSMIGSRNNLADFTKKSNGKKQRFQLMMIIDTWRETEAEGYPDERHYEIIKEFDAISGDFAIREAKKIIARKLKELEHSNPKLIFKLRIIESVWTGKSVYKKFVKSVSREESQYQYIIQGENEK